MPELRVAAVDVAHQAQDIWAEISPRSRSEILRRAFDLMTERSEALARLIVLENGKALPDARSEIAYAAKFFCLYAEEAVRLGGVIEHAPAGTNKIMVLRQPIGVSLLITPWNFPAAMATRKIGPALAAGCSVILKPASETPLTALAIVAILAEAGVPDGVVNIVPSTRSNDLSSALLDHPWCARCRSPGRPRSDASCSSTASSFARSEKAALPLSAATTR